MTIATPPMTGEQRFLAAARREPVDATPAWLTTARCASATTS